MSTGMPGYPMGVCQRLPAGREWGVYKTEKLLSGYEAFCVVSMFIRQAPTDCLWTVVRPRDYVWSEP
jgi:hypothetical protein